MRGKKQRRYLNTNNYLFCYITHFSNTSILEFNFQVKNYFFLNVVTLVSLFEFLTMSNHNIFWFNALQTTTIQISINMTNTSNKRFPLK